MVKVKDFLVTLPTLYLSLGRASQLKSKSQRTMIMVTRIVVMDVMVCIYSSVPEFFLCACLTL